MINFLKKKFYELRIKEIKNEIISSETLLNVKSDALKTLSSVSFIIVNVSDKLEIFVIV